MALAPCSLLFGHQNTMIERHRENSAGLNPNEFGRSDVEDVTGRMPAVAGFDLWDLFYAPELDDDTLGRLIRDFDAQGGVITLSWHMSHPALEAALDCADRELGHWCFFCPGMGPLCDGSGVSAVLPGGTAHDAYLRKLRRVERFLDQLRDSEGELIPIIFRPFHEHQRPKFWWSVSSGGEYEALWQFTVKHFRSAGFNNLLWAYSPIVCPNNFEPTAPEYLDKYPGDDFVDVMGGDCYTEDHGDLFGFARPILCDAAIAKRVRDAHGLPCTLHAQRRLAALRGLVNEAENRGKLAALTEVGHGGFGERFWTDDFLQPIKRDPVARRVSYALFWKNQSSTVGESHKDNYYVAYRGHPSASNMRAMAADQFMVLRGELQFRTSAARRSTRPDD